MFTILLTQVCQHWAKHRRNFIDLIKLKQNTNLDIVINEITKKKKNEVTKLHTYEKEVHI